MTTGELIELLRKVDPEGTTPVCVDNHDIYHVSNPDYAYYDGTLEQLELKQGQIVGARLITEGLKVRLYVKSVEDLLFNQPELPVTVSHVDLNDRVEMWRKEGREYIKQCHPKE
jgi:hypothetical protein